MYKFRCVLYLLAVSIRARLQGISRDQNDLLAKSLEEVRVEHWTGRCLLYGLLYKSIESGDVGAAYRFAKIAQARGIRFSARRQYLAALEIAVLYRDADLFGYLKSFNSFDQESTAHQVEIAKLVFSGRLEDVSSNKTISSVLSSAIIEPAVKCVYAKSLDAKGNTVDALGLYRQILQEVDGSFPGYQEMYG